MNDNKQLQIILSIDPIKFPLTGIGKYTYELAIALSENQSINRMFFLRGFHLCDNIPEAEQTPSKLSAVRKVLQKSRIAAELYRTIIPKMKEISIRGLKDYVYHGPNFYLPPFKGKRIVTVHDLSLYNWPECHPDWRVRYMKSEMKLTLKRADTIITDSEFVKQEIGTQLKFPLEKIFAIPLASSEQYHKYNTREVIPVLGKYSLSPNKYCLFSGTIEPRKNIDTLIDAYQSFPKALRDKWPLVLTGYEGWNSKKLHRRIKDAINEGWARYLGYVPSEDLPKLFAGARLFVFPSLYEGFGLPVLEAMASGVPVVCSNSSSLPEVIGDAGAMCDPLDGSALSELISIGLENEQWRKNAINKGLKRSKLFSWKRCAQETINAYKALLDLN